MIKERLKRYFKKYYEIEKKEKNKTVKKGIIFNIVGIILMFVATYLIYISKGTSLIYNFLIVLLEPGGWFFFWEGLYFVLIDPRSKEPDLHFYKKMSNCTIDFLSY